MATTVTYAPTITAAKINEPAWMKRGLMQTSTGYGRKLTTRYMVQFGDTKRWYRVWCVCFSNSGSLYVCRNGGNQYLDGSDIEVALERSQKNA